MILSKNKNIDNATKNVCNAQMIGWGVMMMKMVRMMKATQTSANWPCKYFNIKFKMFKNDN